MNNVSTFTESISATNYLTHLMTDASRLSHCRPKVAPGPPIVGPEPSGGGNQYRKRKSNRYKRSWDWNRLEIQKDEGQHLWYHGKVNGSDNDSDVDIDMDVDIIDSRIE